MGPAPWEEAEKEKVPALRKPLLAEISASWTERELQRPEESATTSLQQAGTENHAEVACTTTLHAPAREPHPLAQAGWNSGFRGHPRERTAVGCAETA